MPSFVEEDLHQQVQVPGDLEEDILENMDITRSTILLTEDEEENEEEDLAISMEIGWLADLAAAREWEKQENETERKDETTESDNYVFICVFVMTFILIRLIESML